MLIWQEDMFNTGKEGIKRRGERERVENIIILLYNSREEQVEYSKDCKTWFVVQELPPPPPQWHYYPFNKSRTRYSLATAKRNCSLVPTLWNNFAILLRPVIYRSGIGLRQALQRDFRSFLCTDQLVRDWYHRWNCKDISIRQNFATGHLLWLTLTVNYQHNSFTNWRWNAIRGYAQVRTWREKERQRCR